MFLTVADVANHHTSTLVVIWQKVKGEGIEMIDRLPISEIAHFTETNHKNVLAKIRVERSHIILIYQYIS
ncbi:hypothetical protein GCM10028806_24420 [Spirosoma terrae]